MDKSVENQNRNFISDWIRLNPNFSGVKYLNNSISFNNGTKIDFHNFLVSSLLENPIINANIYSIDEYLFYKIMYANTEIYNFYDLNGNNSEYVESIKLTTWGTSYIITNKNKNDEKLPEMTDFKPIEVINAYRFLKEKNEDGIVTVDDLYKKLNKSFVPSEKKDIIFFDLIDSNEKLNSDQIEYINKFSKYMYTLACYQDYLVGEAKKCLDLYKYKMNYLLGLDETNENQKMALNLYSDNVKSFELKEKESSNLIDNSVGFSSLALIISSVVVTLSLILLLIIIH